MYVNYRMALACNIGPLAKEHGNHMNEKNEMATILNNFFSSLFANEDCLSVQPLEVRRTEKILTLDQIV